MVPLQAESTQDEERIKAEIVVLSLNGFSRREIAERLGLSLYKVWKFMKSLLKRSEYGE